MFREESGNFKGSETPFDERCRFYSDLQPSPFGYESLQIHASLLCLGSNPKAGFVLVMTGIRAEIANRDDDKITIFYKKI